MVGIFYSYFSIYTLQLRWDIAYQISIVIYFVMALIFYLVVEQKSFKEKKGRLNKEQDAIDQTIKENVQEEDEESTPKQILNKTYGLVKLFLSRPTRVLWCADYIFQQTFKQIILFWFPFYFVQNGFGTTSIYIVATYYFTNIAGTIIFENGIRKITKRIK